MAIASFGPFPPWIMYVIIAIGAVMALFTLIPKIQQALGKTKGMGGGGGGDPWTDLTPGNSYR